MVILLQSSLVLGVVFSTATAFVAPQQTPFCRFSSTPAQKCSQSPSALAFFNFGGQQSNKDKQETETPLPAEEEPDFGEKIFTALFGKPQDEPFGLKRFDSDRFPEQYPATTTDFQVEPVASDDREMTMLRPLLKNTNLEARGLRLGYDAARDGWDAYKFHQVVDRQGPSLVLCQTRLGLMCGGYNPKGWVGYGEARGSIAAFLFRQKSSLPAITLGPNDWIKLKKVGGPSLAQQDMPETGPSFGADSLVIPLSKNDPKFARSKLGSYYERLQDGGNSLFGKDAGVQLNSLKVYHGVYGPDEYVPFTDAEPFALY